MKRYTIGTGIPALAVALLEHMNADELRKLASFTGGPVPTRKAELADLIAKHLEGTDTPVVSPGTLQRRPELSRSLGLRGVEADKASRRLALLEPERGAEMDEVERPRRRDDRHDA